MEIKNILNAIPTPVWIILAALLLIGFFWVNDDLGQWWENRKQEKFDKVIAEKQMVIDNLTKEREGLIVKAQEAEAREQSKIIEADLLKQEAEKRGVNIAEAQKKIDAALDEYTTDINFIEKMKSGNITKLVLCEKQCKDSAELGYPCRVNYCDRFKE